MALGQCNVEEVGSGVFVFLPLRAAETVRLSFSLSPCTLEGETLFSFPPLVIKAQVCWAKHKKECRRLLAGKKNGWHLQGVLTQNIPLFSHGCCTDFKRFGFLREEEVVSVQS